MPAIEIENLKKYFGKTHAVDGITLAVEQGEIFGFLGPNGAGKTTTIRCMMDFLKPTEGNIKIFNLDSRQDSVKIKEKTGYLTGDVRLYDGWTGWDHIKFLEKVRGRKSNAENLLNKLDLNPNIKFKTLSSGNKQKLGLILAIMFESELMILDEPTLGLDPLLQNIVYDILEDLKAKGSTVFMSSHNLAEVERLCSRVGIIKDGNLVAVESIEAMRGKRMHLVKIFFSGKFQNSSFTGSNITIQQEMPDGIVLGVKGDINPLIKSLSQYKIKDLEISHASLEEIFLEFYSGSYEKEK